MHWLYVTYRVPWGLRNGYAVRIYNTIKRLRALGDDVTLLSYKAPASHIKPYKKLGVDIWASLKKPEKEDGISRTIPGWWFFDERLAQQLGRISAQFDVVVLTSPTMLHYSPEAQFARCVVAEYVDDPVTTIYNNLRHDPNKYNYRFLLKFIVAQTECELLYLRKTALTMFVSTSEQRNFHRRHPLRKTAYIPNGTDFYEPSQGETDGQTIAFSGCMDYYTNVEAADYLVKRIAPLVWRTHPKAQIKLIGAHPSKRIKELASSRVIVTGAVDDIKGELASSTVAVVPMISGAGIKNKILDAWSAGTAIVANPLACSGLTFCNDSNIRIGKTPDELAIHVVNLLNNKACRQKIALAGQQVSRGEMTWANTALKYRIAVLKRLQKK